MGEPEPAPWAERLMAGPLWIWPPIAVVIIAFLGNVFGTAAALTGFGATVVLVTVVISEQPGLNARWRAALLLGGVVVAVLTIAGGAIWAVELAESSSTGVGLVEPAGERISQSQIDEMVLTGADLRGRNMSGLDLTGRDMRGVDAAGASLDGAILEGALLQGSDLRGAKVTEVCLRRTALQGTDVAGADFLGSDLRSAELAGVATSAAMRWPTQAEQQASAACA